MPFAVAVADIFDELKATASGDPAVPEKSSGLAAFIEAAPKDAELFDLFVFARLKSVYEYIRGCKTLRLPTDWRPVVPHVWPAHEWS